MLSCRRDGAGHSCWSTWISWWSSWKRASVQFRAGFGLDCPGNFERHRLVPTSRISTNFLDHPLRSCGCFRAIFVRARFVLCSSSLCVPLRNLLMATSSGPFCAQMQAFPQGHLSQNTMRCTRTLSPAQLCQNCRTDKQVTRENKRKETTSKEQHPAHQEFCLGNLLCQCFWATHAFSTHMIQCKVAT